MSDKTDWYPMSVNPVRDGWYEVERNHWTREVHYLMWKGYFWTFVENTGNPAFALSDLWLSTCKGWRGLTEKAYLMDKIASF